MCCLVKVRQLAEKVEASVDLRACEFLHPLSAEALAGKGAHHATVEHGAAVGGRSQLALRGQIAEEAAGKAVACAGGVDDLFERQGRSPENLRSVEERCAVLAVLDHERLRSQCHQI